MSAHHRVARRLGEYDDLDRAERRMIDGHLRHCEACRGAWSDEQDVRAYLKSLPDAEPPSGLEARLLSIPAMELSGSGPQGALTSWTAPAMLLVAGLIGLAALGAPIARQTIARPAGAPAGSAEPASGPGRGGAAPMADPTTVARAGAVAQLGPLPASPDAVRSARPGPDPFDRRFGRAHVPGRFGAPAGPDDRRSGQIADGERLPSMTSPGAPPPAARPPTAGAAPGSASPSAAPASDPAVICADIEVVVFVDLTGSAAGSDCNGCDGRWSPEDDARATALGMSLPRSFQITVDDASADLSTVDEVHVSAGPVSRLVRFRPRVCGVAPLTVQVLQLPDAWAMCPAATRSARMITAPGAVSVPIGLQPGCPLPLLPTPDVTMMPSATATGAPTFVPTPEGTATPGSPAGGPTPAASPSATEPATPRAPRPTVLPVGSTPPPPNVEPAGPTQPAAPTVVPAAPPTTHPPELPEPQPSLIPIRLRPTPTATPHRQRGPEPGPPLPTKSSPWPIPPTQTPEGPVKAGAGESP